MALVALVAVEAFPVTFPVMFPVRFPEKVPVVVPGRVTPPDGKERVQLIAEVLLQVPVAVIWFAVPAMATDPIVPPPDADMADVT